MNRRGFLGWLGVGAAGFALPALVKAPPVALLPVVEEAPKPILITATWFMYEVSKAIEKALEGHAFKYVPCYEGAHIGYMVGGHVVNVQRWVRLEPDFVSQLGKPGNLDAIRERYVRPVADMLADPLRQKRVRMLTDTALPMAGVENCVRVSSARGEGVPVRGVELYDIAIDANVFRLDVIGATA